LRRAALLLQDLRIGGPPAWWICFEVLGEPIPKARPRAMRGKSGGIFFYSPKGTADAERALGETFRYELGRKGRTVPLEGPLALVVFFYRSNLLRVDDDNLRKLVLDASTRAGVWEDDSQVTAGATLIELDRDRPRTLIALCPHDSSMQRAGKRRKAR
jgi:Holliday junction resolvase RusA-like endonuclease